MLNDLGYNLPVLNYSVEPGNFTRYELIYCEYRDRHRGDIMCSVTWLNNSRGGKTLTFKKGGNLWASYVLEKSGINEPDLVAILCDVKDRFPGSIGCLEGFDGYDENGLWVGKNDMA